MAFHKESNKFSNLYVKNFGDSLNDEGLSNLFSQFGEVISAEVHRSAQGQSLGYGLVKFCYPHEAASAIKNLNGFVVNGRELYVDYHQTREERTIVLASQHLLKGSNLIVQNLEKSIDDLQLTSHFASFGTITKSKVIMKNKQSLGYGYVCYSSVDSAQKALEGMNNKVLKGKRLFVKVHEKKAPQQTTNLRVTNLDSLVNDEMLNWEFSKFGKIISSKVMRNNKGDSKNYGFVRYSSYEEAESAIEHMNNKRFGHKVIHVAFEQSANDFEKTKKQKSRGNSESSEELLEATNLRVGNLDSRVNDEILHREFSKFGKITSAKVMRNNRGESKNYGFVCYSSYEEAESAIEHMNNKDFGHQVIHVAFEQSKNDLGKTKKQKLRGKSESSEELLEATNLRVGNLDSRVNDEILHREFSKFGKITSAKVMRNNRGESKNYGFVCYSSYEEAESAIEHMNNKRFGHKVIHVAFEQSANDFEKTKKQKSRGKSESSEELLEATNLRVGNLDSRVNDEILHREFSKFGKITSAKVMRNNRGESKNYGFVCYSSFEEAESAIEHMNNKRFGHQVIHIAFEQSANDFEKTKKQKSRGKSESSEELLEATNLRVGNLDSRVNDEILHREFSKFGKITSAKVMRNNRGESKNYGFVCYSSYEEAESAIEHMNNKRFGHKVIHVAFEQSANDFEKTKKQKSRGKSESSEELLEATNLHVGNLDSRVNDEILHREFSKFGKITSAKVMRNNRGESKNYGFVCYSSFEEAESAIEHMNNKRFGHQVIHIAFEQSANDFEKTKKQKSRGKSESSEELLEATNLRVGNLDSRVNDEILHREFSKFGKITSAKVMRNNRGESKNYGFVCYSSYEEAESAIEHMNNKRFGHKVIHVAFEQSANDFEKTKKQKSRGKSESSEELLEATNLRVGNLDSRVNDEILHREFSKFGKITSAKVMRNNRGESKNYGFVCYSSYEEAESAIEHMNNKRFGHQVIHVAFEQSANDFEKTKKQKTMGNSESSEELLDNKTVFIKNLDEWMTEDSLQAICSPFGTVVKTKILKANGKSQCLGLVTFESRQEAELAAWELDNASVEEEGLEASLLDDERDFNNRGAERVDDSLSTNISPDEESDTDEDEQKGKTNLYVKNFDVATDEADLSKLFSLIGPVLSVKVARTAQGVSKQFAFVNFKNHDSASRAVKELHNFEFKGSPLYVAFHQNKSERDLCKQQKLIERVQRLAQQDQEKDVTSPRQRAESQDRLRAWNSKPVRDENDARLRSRSHAPRLRKKWPL